MKSPDCRSCVCVCLRERGCVGGDHCRRRAAAAGRLYRRGHTLHPDIVHCPDTQCYPRLSQGGGTHCCSLEAHRHTQLWLCLQTLIQQHHMQQNICSSTCTVRVPHARSVDRFLADLPSGLEPAVLAAGAVPVTGDQRNCLSATWSDHLLVPLLPLCRFLLYLHCAPSLSRQLLVQQLSEVMCSSPGSHSSPCSTREFPHTLTFLSRKQDGALERRRFTMDRLLQVEKSWTNTRTHTTISV